MNPAPPVTTYFIRKSYPGRPIVRVVVQALNVETNWRYANPCRGATLSRVRRRGALPHMDTVGLHAAPLIPVEDLSGLTVLHHRDGLTRLELAKRLEVAQLTVDRALVSEPVPRDSR